VAGISSPSHGTGGGQYSEAQHCFEHGHQRILLMVSLQATMLDVNISNVKC
jgi:hypothetical protein